MLICKGETVVNVGALIPTVVGLNMAIVPLALFSDRTLSFCALPRAIPFCVTNSPDHLLMRLPGL